MMRNVKKQQTLYTLGLTQVQPVLSWCLSPVLHVESVICKLQHIFMPSCCKDAQYTSKLICIRAVPEIILGGTLFCPVGGGCFVDNVSKGWGVGR